jgi:predicted TIM-barrel fold metal-dependent hydrolase
MTAELDFPLFDCDNHYYEAEDAFTRHADPRMASRCMQWATIGGRERLMVGGRVQRFIANPKFDPIARAGCLDAYHRGETGITDVREAFGELEPLPAAYRDREARLRKMDEQGVDGAFLFPTLGVGMEELLKDDIPALHHAFHAFNQWLDDDWGYAWRDRIFATPVIPLADPDEAVRELELVLQRGTRAVCLRMAPVLTANGYRSIADRLFDPFWARVDEAGIVAAFHTGDSGYTRYIEDWEPVDAVRSFFFTPFRLLTVDRCTYDTFAAMLCHGLFERFPNVRALSVENGASWVDSLFGGLRKVQKTMAHEFGEDPIETFKRHVWVSPFQEDDISHYIELLGEDRVVLGSDFPHAEGLEAPADYVRDLDGVSDRVLRRVMRENGRSLSRPLV